MRWLIRALITVAVLIPFLFYLSGDSEGKTDLLSTMEFWAYDTRTRLTASNEPDPKVLILDIDEKSIAEIGQWPWPRDVLADLVNTLFDHYEIEVLGFDMAFPEPDRALDIALIDELQAQLQDSSAELPFDLNKLRAERNRDMRFAESFKDRKVVMGFVMDGTPEGEETIPSVGSLPSAALEERELPLSLRTYELDTYIGNLPVLQKYAYGGGNFNPVTIDADGKFRSVPMLIRHQDGIYESLSLAVARAAIGGGEIQFEFYNTENSDFHGIRIGKHTIPTTDDFEMLVPYRGGAGTFDYLSVDDVMKKIIPKEQLSSAIVLVGTSAAGLKDIRSTPVDEIFPGVEINANLVSAILSGEMRSSPSFADAIQIFVLILSGLILTILMPKLSVLSSFLLSMAMSLFIWFGSMALWNQGLVIPIAASLMFIFLSFMVHTIYGSFIEARRKKQLSKLYGKYVSPILVKKMEEDLGDYRMEPKDAVLSVLFADIEGFTKISENLAAEQVTEMLNLFLTTMTEIIQTTQGTIDKYMGDAIMAFWGAPMDDEEHAQHAIQAAFAMRAALPALNQRLLEKNLPEINVCIGLNTGSMRVGDMGSEFREAYTVIGDEVNLAARIEGLTRIYGVSIIIGENTRKALPGVLCMELDKVMVKGKDNQVRIYQPLGMALEAQEEKSRMISMNNEAIAAYREQNWGAAEFLFQELVNQYPHKVAFQLYLQRINEFKQAPPPADWDGVYRYTSK